MTYESLLLEYEAQIRVVAFVCIFSFVAIGEVLIPKRVATVSKRSRWLNNMMLVVLNSLILRIVFPVVAVGLASFAAEQGWGILNFWQLPPIITVLMSIVVLDLVIYLQHVMFHAVPLLWRLHRVHHTDLDYDVTTGSRFHPLEVILSMLIKMFVILALGPPAIAVLLFEVILNAMAMFNHGNLNLPRSVDRLLRLFMVTPDMHRVHHSIEDEETNSNFGFNLSLWDRIFGTYKAQPLKGHQGMTIGIRTFRDVRQCVPLMAVLQIPFVGKNDEYAINRRWGRSD